MTSQLLIFGILGIATTVDRIPGQPALFSGGRPPGRTGQPHLRRSTTPSASAPWCSVGTSTCAIRTCIPNASYVNYTKMLFTNWAADSAAQDYVIVNVVLMPLWTIVEGRRRGLRWPWIFFVISLFTSLAFSIALFLAFMERQYRYTRSAVPVSSRRRSHSCNRE